MDEPTVSTPPGGDAPVPVTPPSPTGGQPAPTGPAPPEPTPTQPAPSDTPKDQQPVPVHPGTVNQVPSVPVESGNRSEDPSYTPHEHHKHPVAHPASGHPARHHPAAEPHNPAVPHHHAGPAVAHQTPAAPTNPKHEAPVHPVAHTQAAPAPASGRHEVEEHRPHVAHDSQHAQHAGHPRPDAGHAPYVSLDPAGMLALSQGLRSASDELNTLTARLTATGRTGGLSPAMHAALDDLLARQIGTLHSIAGELTEEAADLGRRAQAVEGDTPPPASTPGAVPPGIMSPAAAPRRREGS